MAVTVFEKPMGTEVETLKNQIIEVDSKKTLNIKIYAEASKSIINLIQETSNNTEQIFWLNNKSQISDFPVALSSYANYPYIKIIKHEALASVLIHACAGDGSSKMIHGMCISGVVYWGSAF